MINSSTEKQKREIGARLKEFAKENSTTIAGLSIKLDKHKTFLTKYASGESALGALLLSKLLALGCDINWLLTGEENTYQSENKGVDGVVEKSEDFIALEKKVRADGKLVDDVTLEYNILPLFKAGEIQMFIDCVHQKGFSITEINKTANNFTRIACPYMDCVVVEGTQTYNQPKIEKGDYLVLCYHQEVKNDDICFACLKDGRYFVAKYNNHKDSVTFSFIDKKHTPIVVPKKEISILMRLVEINRKL